MNRSSGSKDHQKQKVDGEVLEQFKQQLSEHVQRI